MRVGYPVYEFGHQQSFENAGNGRRTQSNKRKAMDEKQTALRKIYKPE